MAIEVFNRYEKKYRLDEGTFARLTSRLNDFLEVDAYYKINGGAYTILNLYYDTENSDFIRTSLTKPAYKEKLRLRSYGTPDANSEVYLEIKKKVRGIVNKRRSAMKLPEAYSFLESGVLPELQPHMNGQVLREIAHMLKTNVLKPALALSFERMAYFGNENRDLRISFDTNIRARSSYLRLESGAYGERILPDGEWIMEIKTSQSIPLWLCRLLSEYRIYPAGFSKYGTVYRQALELKIRSAGRSYIPDIAIEQPLTAYV